MRNNDGHMISDRFVAGFLLIFGALCFVAGLTCGLAHPTREAEADRAEAQNELREAMADRVEASRVVRLMEQRRAYLESVIDEAQFSAMERERFIAAAKVGR